MFVSRVFLRGMGSILELWPTPTCHLPKRKKLSDSEALAKDWETIGRDISKVLGDFNKALEKSSSNQLT